MQITPEVINAVKTLRAYPELGPVGLSVAINTLDNAGIFAAVDEATGYDVNPEQRVSKCTCSKTVPRVEAGSHFPNCPGDPAEWGDLAFESKAIR